MEQKRRESDYSDKYVKERHICDYRKNTNGQGITKYQYYILAYQDRENQEKAHAVVGLLIQKKLEKNIKDINYINENLYKATSMRESETTLYPN